ncbi:NDR1/HIN1-like protein 13 [Sorghum bicolor]|uniref:Late embryogenesis abundant protein LEA-2 subgroup domain-containing protein n=1 Tax=Sorghum bicolor TaxID=4558 RepID=C5YQP2_SORBI|nr:NDR1/HIN1-like protein 13 [Sorghum bicolor]EES15581.1 hypothetical protein SORBI_3008G018600 [Sorghum bicolor]|eukprot:XP_002441743.1 NDR1/HIN1-like protein 13 [Sorghum bicolor]
MADRVHPMPSPSSSPLPPPPGRRPPDHHHQQPSVADDDPDPAAAAPATETTPLHPSFFHDDHPLALSPPPGTYIIQVPKDQVLRSPPPDRARRYKKLSGRPARRRRLRRACCLACAALLAILLAAAAFVGAVFLIFRPRPPSFSVPSLAVRGLDALASASSPPLSPSLDAAVRADNGRNGKTGVEYRGGGDVAVSYAGERLAAGTWPAFRQAPRNVTVVAVAMRGQGVRLTDAQRTQLAADRAVAAVPLTVEATVPVRLRFGKVLRTWTVDVKARCEVAVDRLDGNAAVVNKGCSVRVKPLWWWW